MVRIRLGLPPYGVGRDFGQKLINLHFGETMELGKPGPQQNTSVLAQQICGEEIKQTATQHGIQYSGGWTLALGSYETSNQYIGVDDKNAGTHCALWARVSSTAK